MVRSTYGSVIYDAITRLNNLINKTEKQAETGPEWLKEDVEELESIIEVLQTIPSLVRRKK